MGRDVSSISSSLDGRPMKFQKVENQNYENLPPHYKYPTSSAENLKKIVKNKILTSDQKLTTPLKLTEQTSFFENSGIESGQIGESEVPKEEVYEYLADSEQPK